MKIGRWNMIVLTALLLLELWVFSGSFDEFFNHDSLFYLIHSPKSWDRFTELLARPDPVQQYRPLTLGAMSLIIPFMGLDPRSYHWIPLAFHLVNTCLFFLLARRLMPDPLSVLAAVIFWGLHSSAAWVTYDIGYFPDFLMGFFSLLSLILAIDGSRKRSTFRIIMALLLYVGALLSKEAAVALPLVLLISLTLSRLREQSPPYSHVADALRQAVPLTGLYVILALVHSIRLLYWLNTGLLFGQGPRAAYAIDPFANIPGKAMYLYWALYLPEALSIAHPNRNRALALLLMGILLILWFADILRRKCRLNPLEFGGLIWLIGMLAPAYLLSSRTAKWYLYIPAMGLALAIGNLAATLNHQMRGLRPGIIPLAVLTLFLVPVLFSTVVQTRSFLNSSDSAYASYVVRNCLKDFQELHPSLPPKVTLFLLRTHETNVAEFFGGGQLYQMFFPSSRIKMLFADRGDQLPALKRERNDILILQYLYGHVYDVTDYYRGRRADSCALRIISDLNKLQATVSRSEFYPSYDVFQTPNGKPVFFADPGEDILTQIGGSVAVVPINAIPSKAYLRMDISWMHDEGDGGWAELAIRSGGKQDSLYRRYMTPNPKGKGMAWKEVKLDLSRYAGKTAELVLICRNDPGNSTVADWLNWRDIRLESPELNLPGCRRQD
jgi:hypothetical protein